MKSEVNEDEKIGISKENEREREKRNVNITQIVCRNWQKKIKQDEKLLGVAVHSSACLKDES